MLFPVNFCLTLSKVKISRYVFHLFFFVWLVCLVVFMSKSATFLLQCLVDPGFDPSVAELPRFFVSYHDRSRAKLYHRVYFNSILIIPRPILSLWSLPIFAFFRSAQNGSVSRNHQTLEIKQNSMQILVEEYCYHLKLKLFSGVTNCLKASAFNLFNFKPDYCVIN